jgi:hypothetical protein
MNIKGISKDALSICLSFLTEEELIYSKGEWHKFPKDDVCYIAARNGWLDLLKWARENGRPWYMSTCATAASNGNLEILKWARENGYDWRGWICYYAAKNGHLGVLEWIKQNGCMCDRHYHKN